MASPKVLDLDKELGFDADVPITTRKVTLLGMDVEIVCDLNTFGFMNVSGDTVEPAAVMDFLKSMIAPADWPAFVKVAGNHPSFRGTDGAENMMKMVRRLMEVAAEPYPTKQLSDSARGGSTRSTVQKSAAKPSSARVGASKRSR
jgi:hypothetical protein